MRITPLLALAACALTACSNPVVGTWRNVAQNGRAVPKNQQLLTTFSPLGKFTMGDEQHAHQSEGSYLLRNDLLVLTSDGKTLQYRYNLQGNELRLEGGAGSLVFSKAQ